MLKIPQTIQVLTVEHSETDECEDLLSLKMHSVSNPSRNVIWVDLKVDHGKPLKMELVTGLAASIITHELYMALKKFNEIPLQKTELL